MKHFIAFLLFISPFVALICKAQNNAPSPVEAQLLSPTTGIEPSTPFWVGIYLKIEDNWHVYWKNPGNIGVPPSIEWELPEGFDVSDMFWLAPKKFQDLGVTTYGYNDHALLLVKIYPPLSLQEEELEIKAKVKWLACEELCIPGEATLNIKLPIQANPTPSLFAPLFEDALLKLPTANRLWQLTAEANTEAFHLKAHYLGEDTLIFKDAYFFPESPVFLAEPTQDIILRGNTVLIKLPIDTEARQEDFLLKAPESIKGVLELTREADGQILKETIQVMAPVATKVSAPSLGTTAQRPTSEPNKFTPFMRALGFAFIGGLILNLMPCVFPVIGLKIMHLTKQAHEDPINIRVHGIVFSIGILIAFIALASLLIAFKALGNEVGWGFQLQSPVFVTFLILLFFTLGMNFLGLFDWGYFLVGIGHKLEEKPGIWGSFFSGVLASIVATPCTGPFMGVALGFALAQPPILALSIFMGLALGMASPYILLSINPAWIKILPKPGRWTLIIRQALAFPLLASVIWLIWVLGKQNGMDVAVGVLFSLLLLSSGIWILSTFAHKSYKPFIRLISGAFAALLIIVGILNALSLSAQKSTFSTQESVSWHWTPYTDATLNALLKDKQPVFIDFTAAWCITCQANKYTTLRDGKVIEAFRKKGVITLLADWTNQNPEITQALARYGRTGVPLYVFYPRGQTSAPMILPAVLTPQIILKALETTPDLEQIH